MKRIVFAIIVAAAMLTVLAGCGSGGDDAVTRPLLETVIESKSDVDGDILLVAATNTLVPTIGPTARLFAGVEQNLDEYRAFLHFPLVSVPGDAIIQSATLNIVVRQLSTFPAGASIPLLVELVDFTPPLTASDFDLPALPPLSRTTTVRTILPGHVNDENGVDIDVTTLMEEAQALRLPNFQVRLLEDFVASPLGVVSIDDSDAFAPQLTVVYF